MTAERFGQVLSRMRLKRKITSRELANKINMPPSVYIDIEHSRAWPSNDLLTKFEKALDLEPHECSILEYAWNNDHADRLPITIIDVDDADPDETDDEFLEHVKKVMAEGDNKQVEHVNHPDHYHPGKYEVIKVMAEYYGREAVTDFCLLNAFKYISRAKQKNGLEDIKKAVWYLNYIITEDQS